ncbi:hypothetical protein ACHHYP_15718 [Achlya hypogyna]|uniref:EF-hand domain-containing protein n=1 Tax=Achlya hypogyna TaxID=1202772 RepID=A0A1V9YAC9_ACHHY|nr:hypothetical protein ACHHYP_15718 [Achlya hypogyna]
MDFEPEYALLRAASEQAWAIEKRLGVALTDYMRDERRVDWRTVDIPRDVAARIAHVAARLQQDPNMEISRPKPVRRKPAVILPKPKAVARALVSRPAVVPVTAPPPSKVVKPANAARATALRAGIREARANKDNERKKANQAAEDKRKAAAAKQTRRAPDPKSPAAPVTAVRLDLERTRDAAPPSTEVPLPSKSLPPQVSSSPALPSVPQHPPQSLPPIALSPLPADAAAPTKAINNPPTAPPSPVALATTQQSSPMPHQSTIPYSHPPPVMTQQVVSGIGRQVLSDHRTMPSATFGFAEGTAAMSPALLRRLFNDLDADRDGRLTKLEVSVALHRLRIPAHPTRITLFFEQAAQLSSSARLLIDFRQFTAFVFAAREHPEPTAAVPLRRRQLPPVASQPPIVLPEEPPPYLERTVADYIVNRVAESLHEEQPPAASDSVDEATLLSLARQLLAEQIKAAEGVKGLGLEPEQLHEPLPSEVVELDATCDDEVQDLVKALVQRRVREVQSEVLAPPLLSPLSPLPSKELADTATDTEDLTATPAPEVEDKEVQAADEVPPVVTLTLEELPGRTLLGKLLHASPDQRASMGLRRPENGAESTTLLTTLRAMRARRLQHPPPSDANDVPLEHVRSPSVPAIVAELPPPPPPPHSPTTQHSFLPAASDPMTATSEVPIAPKLYMPPAARAVISSVETLSPYTVTSQQADDRFSEGEIPEPHTLSDGEIDEPVARHAFYHTQKMRFERKEAIRRSRWSPSSSLEDGELYQQGNDDMSEGGFDNGDEDLPPCLSSSSDGSFTGSVRAASSTGSIESGQFNFL